MQNPTCRQVSDLPKAVNSDARAARVVARADRGHRAPGAAPDRVLRSSARSDDAAATSEGTTRDVRHKLPSETPRETLWEVEAVQGADDLDDAEPGAAPAADVVPEPSSHATAVATTEATLGGDVDDHSRGEVPSRKDDDAVAEDECDAEIAQILAETPHRGAAVDATSRAASGDITPRDTPAEGGTTPLPLAADLHAISPSLDTTGFPFAHAFIPGAPDSSVHSGGPASNAARVIGAAVPSAAHAAGYRAKLDGSAKWIEAALLTLGETFDALTDAAGAPNDVLVGHVLDTLAKWRLANTTARAAGVTGGLDSHLDRPPPIEILVNGSNWLRRYINARRAELWLGELDTNWVVHIPGYTGLSAALRKDTTSRRRADGSLFHHKHDVAPTPEQLEGMGRAGFDADAHVAAAALDATEAGMALALYLLTGARGSELKRIHLQSLGHERVPEAESGVIFDMLKLTAFETKTKLAHLNQLLAHAHPWRCGCALLGLSVLLRIAARGAPPFAMAVDDGSWHLLGSVVESLDRRLKDLFDVVGLDRQLGDPVTYLGRHFGTRALQHAGGSAPGARARTGHDAGRNAFDNYSEMPLPDLRRLTGRDVVPMPAHLHADAFAAARAAVDAVFPRLGEKEAELARRQGEVRRLGRDRSVQVRTAEQLNDQERLCRALRYVCTTALCALVARPRDWQRWAIRAGGASVWATGTSRAVATLRATGGALFEEAMAEVETVVRRCEDAELLARRTSPDAATSAALTGAVVDLRRDLRDDVLAAVHGTPPTGAPAPAPAPAAPPPHGVRIKRARETQDDVSALAEWPSLADALEYARELAPRATRAFLVRTEVDEHGRSRKVKSRETTWRKYVLLAAAVAAREADGATRAEALAALQAKLDATSYRRLWGELEKSTDRALARRVLDV